MNQTLSQLIQVFLSRKSGVDGGTHKQLPEPTGSGPLKGPLWPWPEMKGEKESDCQPPLALSSLPLLLMHPLDYDDHAHIVAERANLKGKRL